MPEKIKEESSKFSVADLKRAIEIMEEEGLDLNALVQVYANDKEYNITRLGHFHVIPNLTIDLEES